MAGAKKTALLECAAAMSAGRRRGRGRRVTPSLRGGNAPGKIMAVVRVLQPRATLRTACCGIGAVLSAGDISLALPRHLAASRVASASSLAPYGGAVSHRQCCREKRQLSVHVAYSFGATLKRRTAKGAVRVPEQAWAFLRKSIFLLKRRKCLFYKWADVVKQRHRQTAGRRQQRYLIGRRLSLAAGVSCGGRR